LGSLIRLPLPIFFAESFRFNSMRDYAKKDFRSSRAAIVLRSGFMVKPHKFKNL